MPRWGGLGTRETTLGAAKLAIFSSKGRIGRMTLAWLVGLLKSEHGKAAGCCTRRRKRKTSPKMYMYSSIRYETECVQPGLVCLDRRRAVEHQRTAARHVSLVRCFVSHACIETWGRGEHLLMAITYKMPRRVSNCSADLEPRMGVVIRRGLRWHSGGAAVAVSGHLRALPTRARVLMLNCGEILRLQQDHNKSGSTRRASSKRLPLSKDNCRTAAPPGSRSRGAT